MTTKQKMEKPKNGKMEKTKKWKNGKNQKMEKPKNGKTKKWKNQKMEKWKKPKNGKIESLGFTKTLHISYCAKYLLNTPLLFLAWQFAHNAWQLAIVSSPPSDNGNT